MGGDGDDETQDRPRAWEPELKDQLLEKFPDLRKRPACSALCATTWPRHS